MRNLILPIQAGFFTNKTDQYIKAMRNLCQLLVLFFVFAIGASGASDPSFNGGKPARVGFGLAGDEARAAALQPDGKILIFARSYDPGQSSLLRYNADGSTDPTFGDSGKVFLPRSYENRFRIFVLPDGKIVTFGAYYLTRHNPDGSFDTSFSGDGVMPMSVDDLYVQNDGTIIIGYNDWYGTAGNRMTLRKLDLSGEYDTSFGVDGYARVDSAASENLTAVTVQPDGKILAAGFNQATDSPTGKDALVVRLNSDGSLDQSWGKSGKSIVHNRMRDELLNIKVDSTGKVVAFGVTAAAIGGQGQMLAVKFLPGGEPDPSFGINGLREFPWQQDGDNAFNFALQPDNKIVACTATNDDFVLIRLMPDGSYDQAFDGDGIKQTDLIGHDYLKDVIVLPDGRLAAVGGNDKGNNDNVAAVMYFSNGSIDAGFGENGAVFTDAGDTFVIKTVTKVQADGKILSAAQVGAPGDIGSDQSKYLALSRLNADGTRDLSFGDGGKVVWSYTGKLYSLAFQSDGKILVGAARTSAFMSYAATMFRFNVDGTPDMTFGTSGKSYLLDLSPQATGAPTDMVVQPDDKIVVSLAFNHNTQTSAVMRLTPNGSLDNQFDRDGLVFVDLGNTTSTYQTSRLVALRPDGKIVVAGFVADGTDQLSLAQLYPNGTLDVDFGKAGSILDSTNKYNYPSALLLQPDGKIMVLESAWDNVVNFSATYGTSKTTLLRFNPDGTRDLGFGEAGAAQTYFPLIPQSTVTARSAAILSNGGFIVVGGQMRTFITGNLVTSFANGYGPSGLPDNTFPAIDPPTRGNNSVLVDGSGRIVVAGVGDGTGDTNDARYISVIVSRYLGPEVPRQADLFKKLDLPGGHVKGF